MKKLLICLFCLTAVSTAHAADPGGKAAPAAKTKAAPAAPAVKAEAAAKTASDSGDERTARRADIDYWLNAYDGGEFTAGEYRCPPPRFPGVSKENDDIERLSASMEAWQDCHNKAVVHFNAAPSFDKLIPADVARLLTPGEMAQASARLKLVRDNVAETLQVRGKLVVADFGAWRDGTQAWVKEHNAIVNSGPSEERQRDINARRENYAAPSAKR